MVLASKEKTISENIIGNIGKNNQKWARYAWVDEISGPGKKIDFFYR